MAMMGLGSPTGPLPLGLPPMSPPVQEARALPTVNGHGGPAAKAAPTPVPASVPTPAPAPAPAAKAASPVAPASAESSGARTPVFAAPLLSHNLFSLPLPGQKKRAPEAALELQPEVEVEEDGVEEAEIVEAVVVDVPLAVEEAVEAPVPELTTLVIADEVVAEVEAVPPVVAEGIVALALNSQAATPVNATTPAPAAPAAIASPPILASPALGRPAPSSRASSASAAPAPGANGAQMPAKDAVLALLDAEVARARLGMEGQVVDGEEEGEEEREPLDKSVFVRGVRELLARPGFSTALYSRYLGRWAEEVEGGQ